MTINERLAALRKQMKSKKIQAYIIPSSDPHQSEYVAERWKSRQWISGFTGSMGYAVVTKDHAGVWTDSRYFLQCEMELAGTEFSLYKQLIQGAPEHIDWLAQNLESGSRVGIDGALFSLSQVRSMQKTFAAKDIDLVTDLDLITPIWEKRPKLPTNAIFEHDVQYAGATRAEKLDAIRAKMADKEVDFHLVTTLDDIGWTLNLRGSDVECNPVFIAYMLIGHDRCDLFVDPSKVSEELKSALNTEGVFIRSYDTIFDVLEQLKSSKKILVDPSNANFQLVSAIKKAKIVEGETFSILMKAIKNPTEQRWLRNVMVKDGVALVKAFRWLEEALDERTVTEYEFASIIAQYRSDQALYFGESFDAIIGYNGNGAIIHYHPDPYKSAEISKKGILLVDSGGQYQDGTTDITRTIALGEPSDEQKTHFTLVLKGHIALARAKFPAGTKGIQLDILARMFLWQEGLNYGHGTGHGVGFFMNVHEPPQGFVTGFNARGATVHEPGMFSSNEPGFYKEGAYGIRIENLVLCVEDSETAFGKFYRFDTVTLFPIDRKLIDADLLKKEERKWLNRYHKEVYKALAPHLNKAEKAWLKRQCRKV